MKRVTDRKKRRCPYCSSDKWEWLGAVPIDLETLSKYLLQKYLCKNCGKEFLVEEAAGAHYVDTFEQCPVCTSKRIEKLSRRGADIDLRRCMQCNAFLAFREP